MQACLLLRIGATACFIIYSSGQIQCLLLLLVLSVLLLLLQTIIIVIIWP